VSYGGTTRIGCDDGTNRGNAIASSSTRASVAVRGVPSSSIVAVRALSLRLTSRAWAVPAASALGRHRDGCAAVKLGDSGGRPTQPYVRACRGGAGMILSVERYTKKRARVLGHEMAYVEVGSGDPGGLAGRDRQGHRELARRSDVLTYRPRRR